MRDPDRIRPFLEEIAKFWEKHPDWRFGQLVMNLSRDSSGAIRDVWNWEEPTFLAAIGDFIEEKDLTVEEIYQRLIGQMPKSVVKTFGEDHFRNVAEDYYFDLHRND